MNSVVRVEKSGGNRDADQAGVVGMSDGLRIRREVMIDNFGDAGRGGEVGLVKLEAHLFGRLDRGRWTLHDGSARDAAHGRMVDRLRVAGAAGDEAASDYGALRNGINLAVDAAQAGHQQQAALQTGGVAHGRHGGVDLHSRLREWRKRRRHHHRGRVFHQDESRIHGDAHLLQHVGEALRGKERLLPVAGALQSNHDAVTNQLILADAFERDQFLETRGGRIGGGRQLRSSAAIRIISKNRMIWKLERQNAQ